MRNNDKRLLDHAIGNLAMVYGLSRDQVKAAKAEEVYAEQMELLAGILDRLCARVGGDFEQYDKARKEIAECCAALVLQAAGHFPKWLVIAPMSRAVPEQFKQDWERMLLKNYNGQVN